MRFIKFYIIFLIFGACQQNESPVVTKPNDKIELIVPNNYITAGNGISIQLINPSAWNGAIKMFLKSALNVYQFDINLEDEIIEVDVNGSYLEDTGMYECFIMSGSILLDKKSFLVKAHDLKDPIQLFSGPNTIWVNDLQESMIVAIGKDKFGNPGREGDSLSFQFTMPNGLEKKENVQIKNQLAYKKLSSGARSGKIFTGVSGEKFSSKEQRLDVIELWPIKFKIESIEHVPYADSRQFYKLKTSVLKDRNGDIIPDGTMVKFYAIHESEQVNYNAYTIDGVANVYIKNPSLASQWEIKAYVGTKNLSSNTLRLNFESNVKSLAYKRRGSSLVVGPVTSYVGQYVSDGTLAYVKFSGKEIFKELEDGKAEFELPDGIQNINIRVGDKNLIVE